jgi:hypothetical protein
MENHLDLIALISNLSTILSNFENDQNITTRNSHIPIDHTKIAEIIKNQIDATQIQDNKKHITKSYALENKIQSNTQIGIFDEILVSKIMNVYLNEENRIIFNMLKKPLTIQEIVTACKTRPSSTYRRISHLLKNGYVRISGYKKEIGKKSKSTKYEKTIQNITIHINDNLNLVILNIKKNIINETKTKFVTK